MSHIERSNSHRFHWRQIVCYSDVSNSFFHFRRLRTHLYGTRTEMVIRIRTYIIFITGCFFAQLTTHLFYLNWHILHKNIQQVTQAPCVTALILSECTNSSYKATRTALSRTAPDIIILICSPSPSVLALILLK